MNDKHTLFFNPALARSHPALSHKVWAANQEITMSNTFKASRDIIVRTEKWSEALEFYGSVLGFPITERSETIVGFETGAFCLYVERGKEHGPVFDFLVRDIQATKRQLVAAGCTVIEENPKVPRCYLRDPYGMVFNVGQSPGEK